MWSAVRIFDRAAIGVTAVGLLWAVAAYDDATKALAGAAKKLADQAPPDDASTRLRDRLAPLVQTTERDLGDAAEADDDDALRAAITGLDGVAGRLNDLIEQHQ
jgi:hypothetical protein